MDAYGIDPEPVQPWKWLPLILVILFITAITVSLRTWVRLRMRKAWTRDDTMLVIAQFNLTVCIALYVVTCFHYPAPGVEPDERQYRILNYSIFFSTFSYVASTLCLKASVAIFFYNLARVRWQKLLILIPVTITFIFSASTGFAMFFRCGVPIRVMEIITNENCQVSAVTFTNMLVVYSTLHALCDWTFGIVPFVIVRSAQKMSRRSRRAAYVLICLSMAASVASILRITVVGHYRFGPELYKHDNSTVVVSLIETGIGTAAISMVRMKPLLRPFRTTVRKILGLSTDDCSGQELPARRRMAHNYLPIAERSQINLAMTALGRQNLGLLPDSTFTESFFTDDVERGGETCSSAPAGATPVSDRWGANGKKEVVVKAEEAGIYEVDPK